MKFEQLKLREQEGDLDDFELQDLKEEQASSILEGTEELFNTIWGEGN